MVGEGHAALATRIRRCLDDAAAQKGHEASDETARTTAERASRLRRFFGQPFFIAEPYTKRPGSFVSRAAALSACAGILDGAYDDIPEQAFHFVGGIDEVLARAEETT
ncbi:MAG: hypothetical protein C5B48_14785 [Candidatus Rokuibacteriota bacterium]|nr:MAG: hypothetical protein C5B48_14785 [Candidatus Rokubacteria bacterium]